jgi:hypothetical protein
LPFFFFFFSAIGRAAAFTCADLVVYQVYSSEIEVKTKFHEEMKESV